MSLVVAPINRHLLTSLRRVLRPSAAGYVRAYPLEVFSRGFCSAAVPVALVKELRDRTGASMGKCRDALREEGGDMEKAVHWLRMRGMKSMERRTADSAEALLAMGLSPSAGAIVEMRAETDFVTRSELFQRLCLSVAVTAARATAAGTEELLQIPVGGDDLPKQLRPGASIKEGLLEVGSVLGEKLLLTEAKILKTPPSGVIAGYVHPKQADGMPGTGRLVALVALRPVPADRCDLERLRLVAVHLARHVVAAQPRFLNIGSIPVEVLQRERETFKAAYLDQLGPRKSGGVDDKVMAKVLDGKSQRFYQDTVLLCQELVAPQVQSGEETNEAKSLPVAEWLEAEAHNLGLEQLFLEDFSLSVL